MKDKMESKEKGKDKNNNFEFYMKEVDRVITEMEDGNIDQLDKLIENYEYGTTMIEKCNKLLKEAELRIHKITKKVEKDSVNESI